MFFFRKAQACNTEPYIGSVCVFAFDWCPCGYVPADGRSLSIRENTALFGLIGFSYGGAGWTSAAKNGFSLGQIAIEIIGSPEARATGTASSMAMPGMTCRSFIRASLGATAMPVDWRSGSMR